MIRDIEAKSVVRTNWLEELVANWFKIRGYLTIPNIRLPGKRGDLDLLAFNDKEVYLVDLRTYITESTSYSKEASELVKRLNRWEQLLKLNPPYSSLFVNKRVKRLFIASGDTSFNNYLKNSRVAYVPFDKFMKDMIKRTGAFVNRNVVPFSEGEIGRLIWELIKYGALK